MKMTTNHFFPFLAAFSVPFTASAAFVLVDDMEGSNAWTGTSALVADPAGGSNQVLSVSGLSQAYRSIPSIANNTTGTLFFRIRATASGADMDWIWGASDDAVPAAFNSYEGYGRISNTSGAASIDVRNTGATGDFSTAGAASSNTWYNVWLVLNNTNNTTDLYFNTGGDATSGGTQSFTGGVFRNGTTSGLVTFLAKMNESGTTGYIDDLYIDTAGANLVNPVPEPSLGLLALLGFAGFVRRRR